MKLLQYAIVQHSDTASWPISQSKDAWKRIV